MKRSACVSCGGPLPPGWLTCEYCGSQYVVDYDPPPTEYPDGDGILIRCPLPPTRNSALLCKRGDLLAYDFEDSLETHMDFLAQRGPGGVGAAFGWTSDNTLGEVAWCFQMRDAEPPRDTGLLHTEDQGQKAPGVAGEMQLLLLPPAPADLFVLRITRRAYLPADTMVGSAHLFETFLTKD